MSNLCLQQVYNFRVSTSMPRQLASIHGLSVPGAVLALEEGAAIDSFSNALAEWRRGCLHFTTPPRFTARHHMFIGWQKCEQFELLNEEDQLVQLQCLHVQDDTLKQVVPCRRKSSWKELVMLAWPGTLNMLSIIVQGMGLQYISASVSQMISGDNNVCALCCQMHVAPRKD